MSVAVKVFGVSRVPNTPLENFVRLQVACLKYQSQTSKVVLFIKTSKCVKHTIVLYVSVCEMQLLESIGPATEKLKTKGVDFSLWFKPENYHTEL